MSDTATYMLSTAVVGLFNVLKDVIIYMLAAAVVLGKVVPSAVSLLPSNLKRAKGQPAGPRYHICAEHAIKSDYLCTPPIVGLRRVDSCVQTHRAWDCCVRRIGNKGPETFTG